MSKAIRRAVNKVSAKGAQARSDDMAAQLSAKKTKPAEGGARNMSSGATTSRQRRSTLLK
jgi:hypothetical protein